MFGECSLIDAPEERSPSAAATRRSSSGQCDCPCNRSCPETVCGRSERFVSQPLSVSSRVSLQVFFFFNLAIIAGNGQRFARLPNAAKARLFSPFNDCVLITANGPQSIESIQCNAAIQWVQILCDRIPRRHTPLILSIKSSDHKKKKKLIIN